jgi:hypothetical protein
MLFNSRVLLPRFARVAALCSGFADRMTDHIGKTAVGDHAAGNGFARLLREEWSTFWSIGRTIGLFVGALGVVSLGLLFAASIRTGTMSEGAEAPARPPIPIGPGGEAVTDRFYFVHRPLAGDGSMTARLTSMTGIITYPPPNHDQIIAGVVPWAKAGLMIKRSIEQGSAYAAVMLTGSHGVRMQHNYVGDRPGRPGGVSAASPRWLRLTRSGETLTGYESPDGTQWSEVSNVRVQGLPETVQVGLFVASPSDVTVAEGAARFTSATGVFDNVDLQGQAAGGWVYDDIGAQNRLPTHLRGKAVESGGTFTVTGSGDIAPVGFPDGQPIENTLIGTWIGTFAFIIVGVTFFRAKSGRDLAAQNNLSSPAAPDPEGREEPGRNSLTRQASAGSGEPTSERVLAAKAIVVGAVTFVVGLAAVSASVILGERMLRSGGNDLLPITRLTELRVIVGTAAVLGLTAVLGLALGALFRRRLVAAAIGISLMVLPLVVAVAIVLPGDESHWEPRLAASQWLLRLTPAAGFAIRQSIPEYPQVLGPYTPMMGYYPLSPWAGFSVLCGYTAFALARAGFLLRRRHPEANS